MHACWGQGSGLWQPLPATCVPQPVLGVLWGGHLQNWDGRSGASQHPGEQTLLPPRFKRLWSDKRTWASRPEPSALYGTPGRPWGHAAAQRGPDSRALVSLGPRWDHFSAGGSVLSVLGEAHGTRCTRLWVMTQPGGTAGIQAPQSPRPSQLPCRVGAPLIWGLIWGQHLPSTGGSQSSKVRRPRPSGRSCHLIPICTKGIYGFLHNLILRLNP